MENVTWKLSQLYHVVAFAARKRRTLLETGALIISVDVDVGDKSLGTNNKGLNDRYVNDYLSEYEVGEIEEIAVPLLIRLFDDLDIPATFAVRGQLTETDGFILNLLRNSNVKHDIGSHGYSHKTFPILSKSEAEEELRLLSKGMKKFNIEPKSFVFPKNKIAHLPLLEKYGYKCYRGSGGFRYDTLHIEKHNQLYNIHPSFFIGRSRSQFCLNKLLDIAANKKLPFHIWFHPADLGHNKLEMQKKINRVFLPLLKHAKKKERKGEISFETMYSSIEKIENAQQK